LAIELGLEERVVMAMKQLGFTASDARTYFSLLKSNPATGYELAANSGVPRSAIYNVLNRLESRGLVTAIQRKPARYMPLSPERLFELIESRFARNLEDLKNSLESLEKQSPGLRTWTIQGYPALLDRARKMIKNAQQSVHLSIWHREFQQLEDALCQAVESKIDVLTFSFTKIEKEFGRVLSYGIDETELEKFWPHKLILIADRKSVLVGQAQESEENHTLMSEESALVEMAISNLVLDITLFGQRREIDTSEVITGLTAYLAPVEEMVNGNLDKRKT
jgi:HTH-type transcriptional regulator, sugar sensing transcriptional regulator